MRRRRLRAEEVCWGLQRGIGRWGWASNRGAVLLLRWPALVIGAVSPVVVWARRTTDVAVRELRLNRSVHLVSLRVVALWIYTLSSLIADVGFCWVLLVVEHPPYVLCVLFFVFFNFGLEFQGRCEGAPKVSRSF